MLLAETTSGALLAFLFAMPDLLNPPGCRSVVMTPMLLRRRMSRLTRATRKFVDGVSGAPRAGSNAPSPV